MEDPKITIIVPIYKVEKYLSKCIDSILIQTFTDFELILVNDGACIYTWRINGYCRCNIHRDHCY